MIMQKSQLLATLAAATLLASAGTALAQSPRVSFSPSSGSVSEGATADADAEHPLLIVTVRAWNLPAGPAGEGAGGQPTARQQAIDALGEITIETDGIGRREAATISPLYDTDAALDEDTVFAASDRFQLTVTPVQDADSLNDEFILRLRSTEAISTGSAFRGTVIDDDPLGTATFSHTDIRVFEESTAELSIRLTAAQGRSLPTRFDTRGNADIVLAVTPGAAVRVEACPTEGNRSNALRVWSETETLARGPGWGEVTIDKDISEYAQAPAELRLTACGDMTEFRDSRFTLAFKESSLHTPAGRIAAGPPAVIQVRNDDPLPTVSLAPPEIAVDEGKTRTFAIAAEGRLAGAVMRVGVRVTGDALISLSQDGRRLRARADGIHTVTLGENAISKLTIRADEDDTLADNQTKTARVTIVDAGGANIGEEDRLVVTVRGSTAVPALPLVGQLLLTVLLLVGGLRLHSTRTRTARRL